jgi:hypothetical protein
MTITISPDVAAALKAAAAKRNTDPQHLALEALRNLFLPGKPEPRDDWERALFAAAIDCGVSLTDEDLSREHMYD